MTGSVGGPEKDPETVTGHPQLPGQHQHLKVPGEPVEHPVEVGG